MGSFEGAWVRGKGVDCTKAATLLPEVTFRFSAPEKPLLSLIHAFLIEDSSDIQIFQLSPY